MPANSCLPLFFCFGKIACVRLIRSIYCPPRPVRPDRALIHLVFPVQPCAGKRKKQKKRKKYNTKRQQCLLQYRYDKGLRQGSAFFFFCHLYLLAVQTQKACIYLSVSLVSEVAWSNENMFCTCFSVAEKKKSGKKLRLGKRFFVIDMIDTHLEFTVR